ncbi:hypothetical protein PFICI_12218 [Pestalotiopsis fici W106-1]|uniref:DUF6594 domain-containing protein n=1 Tax=Pestalotiopsis fici (strain W106-1 / CGMCC3.15140) TaxID=1229662 RepID=W3WNC4_PESFW|nr:uncharacterized protein PFICI_12218 [Pestalotiopsis fici W106-1]ETS75274.1 hypothetical protein PFICI_12218 [Pestalotiopsis fici W106-1]
MATLAMADQGALSIGNNIDDAAISGHIPSPSSPAPEKQSPGWKKSHQRLVTAVRVSDVVTSDKAQEIPVQKDIPVTPGDNGKLINATKEETVMKSLADQEPSAGIPQPSELPSTSFEGHSLVDSMNESESSSSSDSTVIGSSDERGVSRGRRGRSRKTSSQSTKLDALRYLESDSIRTSSNSSPFGRSSVAPLNTSPSSQSSTSSRSSGFYSDGLTGDDTDRSTSPEQSPFNRGLRIRPGLPYIGRRHSSYGTPEMPRGNTTLPHVSPKVLTSRILGQPHPHVSNLPRAEKLPLTGYEQLASQLSSQGSESSGPHLRPIYRRFEKLNHRLLLHLQDEISELEEQLHRLDTADTQTRRLQTCIMPASRRAETLAGGELQWHRTDILGKIGFKLEQYNRILASFQATECFETPTMADVHEYRGYLATHRPIVEIESQFLDAGEDLICLGDTFDSGYDEDAAPTPTPRRGSISFEQRSLDDDPQQYFPTVNDKDSALDDPSVPINLALAIAVVVPTLIFSLIPGLLGRMVVVALVGTGVVGILRRGHVIGTRVTKDFCICAGTYGAIMAVIASVCG